MTTAILLKDVSFQLPNGSRMIGKSGLTIRIDMSERIAKIGSWHVDLNELSIDEYEILS